MKKELEFVGSFATSILLLAGSFAVAQNATTAKPKKAMGTSTAAVSATQDVSTSPTIQAAAATTASQPATQPQPSATGTKPTTMVSADKRTIPVPQL